MSEAPSSSEQHPHKQDLKAIAALFALFAILCCGGMILAHESPNIVKAIEASQVEEAPGDLVLTVSASTWSGWAPPGTKSEPKATSYDVELGKRYGKSADGGYGLAFTITWVGGSSVTIETDEGFCPRNSPASTGLGNVQHEFFVTTDSECKLTTPTMDGGTTYVLTLSRK